MKHGRSRFVFITAGILMMLAVSLLAQGATAAGGMSRLVQLTAGKADTVDLGKSVADVLVANPAVADVGTLRSNRLYIVGKSIGDTNVLAFDEAGNQLADITVRVRADERGLQDALKSFFPGEDISVRTVKEEVVLQGKVSTPSVANKVRDLASRFVSDEGKTVVDLMNVNGEQQVMLKVKVIEAKRAALREYGFETDYRPNAPGGARFNTASGVGLTSLVPFATGQIFVDDNGRFGPLRIAISAMEKDGLINTLAEPNLTAISGETAGFLAGGEFPVPTARDRDGNITLEFKQFGVSLNFTPTVMSSERISLQMSTEVSTKSDEDGVTIVDTKIPGLAVRRAETTVQMGSGGTLMIAGLIKSDTVDALSGYPGMKDVPILGELFKSKSFARNETELIILVTPYIVEPYAVAEAVSVPDTFDTAQPAPVMPEIGKSKGAAYIPPSSTYAPMKKAAANDVMPAPVRQTPAGAPVLSRVFTDNMKSVYGARVPIRTDAPGYMVD
jgi:pilus assembly protein CpaC